MLVGHELWAYPVAREARRAIDALKTDGDATARYEQLQYVGLQILRLMALHTLGGVTPSSTASYVGLLSKPTDGQLHQFVREALARSEHHRDGPLARLSQCFWAPHPRPHAMALFSTASERLAPDRGVQRGDTLNWFFGELVWLRNIRAHRPPHTWGPGLLRDLLELQRACIEELLAYDELRDALAFGLRSRSGALAPLDGDAPLEQRAQWDPAELHFAGRDVDLQGILAGARCRHCRAFELFQLAQVDDRKPEYLCCGCGMQTPLPEQTVLLRRRLGAAQADAPWVDVPRPGRVVTVDTPVHLKLEIFNPLQRTLRDVRIEFDLPDSVDLGDVQPVIEALRCRTSATYQATVFPREPGIARIAPRVVWSAGSHALPVLPLEVVRERRIKTLVGREAERSQLRAAAHSPPKDTALATIEGARGVGCTALLDGFWDDIPRSMIRLRTSCSADPLRPTKSLVDLVLKYARYELGIEHVEKERTDILLFPGDLREAIRLVAREAGITIGALEQPPRPAGTPELMERQHAELLHGFLSEVSASHSGLVLCLDGLNNAHPTTLNVLRELGHGFPPLRLLIVATLTTDEPARDTSQDPVSLVRLVDTATWRHRLGALSRAEVDVFLASYYPRNLFASSLHQRLWEASRGNPLFLIQTLNSLEENGTLRERAGTWECTADLQTIDLPSEVKQSIDRRFDRMPREYIEFVQKAAVLGERFPRHLLEALPGAKGTRLTFDETAKLANVVAELERSYDIIRSVGDEEEFTHHRLWNTAYHQLSAWQRETLHQQVVRHLEDNCAPSIEREVQIAKHSLKGRMIPRGITAAVTAVKLLLDERRNEEAFGLAEQALQLAASLPAHDQSRRALWLAAARVFRRVGRSREAIALEEENARQAEAVGDHDGVLQARLAQAYCHQVLDEGTEAEKLLAVAGRLAEARGMRRLLADILANRSASLQQLHRSDEATADAERCLDLCRDVPDTERSRADCALTLAQLRHQAGDIQGSLLHAREAHDLFQRIQSPDLAKANLALSELLAAAGELAGAREAATAALEGHVRSQSVADQGRSHLRLGELHTRMGEPLLAARHLDDAARLWRQIGNPGQLAACVLAQARLAFERDAPQRAEELAREALETFRTTGARSNCARATAVLIRALVRHAEEPAVVTAIRAASEFVDCDASAALELDLALASAQRFLRHHEECARILDPYSQADLAPLAAAALSFERSCLLRATSQQEQARAAATFAVSTFRRCGDSMAEGRAAMLLAQTLIDLGDLETSEAMLGVLVATFVSQHDVLGQALGYQELGRIARMRGQDDIAANRLETASKLRHDLLDYRGISMQAETADASLG